MLKFKPRKKIYARANLTYDPATGEGRSYDWYAITKRINGVLVLNSFRYSVTTSKHVSELRGLFHSLGLAFVEIEAPRGLQDLETAKGHTLDTFASEVVQRKYARIKRESDRDFTARWQVVFSTLNKIGAPSHDASSLARSMRDAEDSRTARLQRGRESRRPVVKITPPVAA